MCLNLAESASRTSCAALMMNAQEHARNSGTTRVYGDFERKAWFGLGREAPPARNGERPPLRAFRWPTSVIRDSPIDPKGNRPSCWWQMQIQQLRQMRMQEPWRVDSEGPVPPRLSERPGPVGGECTGAALCQIHHWFGIGIRRRQHPAFGNGIKVRQRVR